MCYIRTGKDMMQSIPSIRLMKCGYPISILYWLAVLFGCSKNHSVVPDKPEKIAQENQSESSDEVYRREERRRREAEARKTPATPAASTASSTSEAPSTAHVPAAARAQEDEDDNVEEVYTDYPATHSDG